MMFVSALVQYNSAIEHASASVRLRWEYRPGSELFVGPVYRFNRRVPGAFAAHSPPWAAALAP
jgi:hypothetical protein